MASKQYTVSEIATFLSSEFIGDGGCVLTSLSTLQAATAGDLSFIANKSYQKALSTTDASAVILSKADLEHFSGNAIVCVDPYLAYAKVSRLFEHQPDTILGISKRANIDASASIADSAVVAAGVSIAANCRIGERVVIGENTVVGENCTIADGTVIKPNVTIYHGVTIGNGCLIHSGVVLGSDGFGFAPNGSEWVKIAQLGGVKIQDNVEIGAGTTIDRGALEDTVIGKGAILDNLIQIAHNVQIGENTAIAGCTAIAGSTKVGAQCTIAGACGIAGHVTIADGTHITGMSMITKSISEPGVYSSGTGMLPHKAWQKNVIRFRQLDEMARRIKSIEDKITEIKGS
jgi:UDP-3-O-[3-hydroxymyristoyl] glucosamine N-acyltransferase